MLGACSPALSSPGLWIPGERGLLRSELVAPSPWVKDTRVGLPLPVTDSGAAMHMGTSPPLKGCGLPQSSLLRAHCSPMKPPGLLEASWMLESHLEGLVLRDGDRPVAGRGPSQSPQVGKVARRWLRGQSLDPLWAGLIDCLRGRVAGSHPGLQRRPGSGVRQSQGRRRPPGGSTHSHKGCQEGALEVALGAQP